MSEQEASSEQTDTLLRKAMEERAYVWVHGPHTCFMGFVLGLSESLVLIQRFQDFAEYGYAVLRRDVVGEVLYRTRPLIFFQRMMKAEGVLGRVGLPFELPLDSMDAALLALQKQRSLVMFERDDDYSDDEDEWTADEDWTVGEVLSSDAEKTEVRHVSSSGQWEERVRVLETPQIQRIEFESPYLRNIAKYSLRSRE
jgi:hypothetical protein